MTENKPLGSLAPGKFSDEDPHAAAARNEYMQQALEKAKELRREKEELIQTKLDNGDIQEDYARLLKAIHASTLEPASAELEKVKAALLLREQLKDTPFATGKIAYLGAGTDWEFPVALGATDIIMEDLDYIGHGLQEEVMNSIRGFSTEVEELGDRLRFQISINGEPQSVQLCFASANVREYVPNTPLDGVLEMLGPTKSYTNQLLLPEIAAKIQEGGIILNHDYAMRNQNNNAPDGTSSRQIEGFTLYEVTDPQLFMIDLNSQTYQAPVSPDLTALRNALRQTDEKVSD